MSSVHPVSSFQSPVSLTVCVEALNEAAALRGAVEDLLQNVKPIVRALEVIIVDDGSTDGTGALADALAAEHPGQVRAVHHARPLGIGASFRDALRLASGEYFCDFHGDHENSAMEIAQAVPHAGPGCAVTTQHVDTDPRPLHRKLISCTYTGLVNALFGLNVRYFNGITLYPTAALRSVPLAADGFLFAAEALVKMARRGLQVKELEYPLRVRRAGASKALGAAALKGTLRDVRKIVRAGRAGGR